SIGRGFDDDLVAARVGSARQHAVEQAFTILLRRPHAGPTVVRRSVIAERDEAVQVPTIQSVLRKMSLFGDLRVATLLTGRQLPGFVARPCALINFEQAIERRVAPQKAPDRLADFAERM